MFIMAVWAPGDTHILCMDRICPWVCMGEACIMLGILIAFLWARVWLATVVRGLVAEVSPEVDVVGLVGVGVGVVVPGVVLVVEAVQEAVVVLEPAEEVVEAAEVVVVGDAEEVVRRFIRFYEFMMITTMESLEVEYIIGSQDSLDFVFAFALFFFSSRHHECNTMKYNSSF